MEFVFNERKAAQAAARLLRRHGEAMWDIKLAKLLYLADRSALCQNGYSITGDRLVAMSFGPILDRVFKRFRTADHAPGSPWIELLICGASGDVRAHGEPDYDHLSDYDVEVLDCIYDEFGAMDVHELARHMFELPEWTDPEGGTVTIDPKVIMRTAGFSEDDLAAIAEQLNAERALALALGE